jgi:hypothetical protein
MRNIIKKLLREALNSDKTISCEKCGWDWKKSESGADMYFCHKCGYDNTPDNINEAAKGINDLPKDIALFNADWGGGEEDFILYSKFENKIYGVLSIIPMKIPNSYEVGRVKAERGYGPFMYEMVMSYISPRYLMPSRTGDIESRAMGVWYKFHERGDISKKVLKIDDKYFNFAIITGDQYEKFDSVDEKKELFDSLDKEEQFEVTVFNTMYQYRNPIISKLIKRGQELINTNQVDIKDLTEDGIEYFHDGDY